MNYLERSQSNRRHSFTDSLKLLTSTGLHFAWTLFFAYGTPTSVSAMPHEPPGTGSFPAKHVCLNQIWATSGDRRRTQTSHNVATEYQFIMSPAVAEVSLKPDERTPKLYANRRCQKLFIIHLYCFVQQHSPGLIS
jgi:hypothetical protein